MSWSPDRIPIWLPPVPGEALDSWLAAYARRLNAAEADLIKYFELGTASFDFMVRALTSHEREALASRTGVSPVDLTAMTLEPWNGLVINLDLATRKFGLPPTLQHTGRYSRFCPPCLRETEGRWQLSWRLPWSYACPRHDKLLLDRCPNCGNFPYINKRRIRTQPGICIEGTGDTRCGFPLSYASCVELDPDGRVMRGQKHINSTVLGPARELSDARQHTREISIIAQRVLRALPSHASTAPALVHEVLAECGDALPTTAGRQRQGSDPHSMAVGSGIAVTVLNNNSSEYDAIFPWLMHANASSRTKASYPITWAHGLYKEAGPRLATRALVSVDEKVSWLTRIRYGTTTSAPAWPTLHQQEVRRRASRTPSMLWPGWTMRVLQGASTGHQLAGFRRAAAALLLLPATQLTYQQAAKLLGNNLPVTSWKALTAIVSEQDCTVLTTTLVLLGRVLDVQDSPINYHRRRVLFSEGEVMLDSKAFRTYCRQNRRLYNETLYEQLLWYVRSLLLGAEPGSSSRSQAWHMQNSHLVDSELRALAYQQAEANLQSHGIHEPLQWEPPQAWLPTLPWPGLPPEDIDREEVAEQLALRLPIDDASQAVGISDDKFRLYIEYSTPADLPVPSERPRRVRRKIQSQNHRTSQWRRLTPEELHQLYVSERKSTPQIAALVGCSSSTIGLHLEQAGIPRRRRKEPLRAADGTLVTEDWLRRHYTELGRTTKEIANEIDCHNAYVSQLLRQAGIPTRPLFAVCSPFVRLGVKMSPAMIAVSELRNHAQRLRNIVRLPGHHDIAAACRALGIPSSSIRYQLVQVENAAGFAIITPTKPLDATPDGATFIAEAKRLLALLDQRANSKLT
ncbi:TniQ family protein [Streptomyces sp. NPDC005548]|uniref:TniQ family protein n=1 Tax=Streptomyces sp. NPDC005548 TaxID=3364724 RepID=UPI0036BB12E6